MVWSFLTFPINNSFVRCARTPSIRIQPSILQLSLSTIQTPVLSVNDIFERTIKTLTYFNCIAKLLIIATAVKSHYQCHVLQKMSRGKSFCYNNIRPHRGKVLQGWWLVTLHLYFFERIRCILKVPRCTPFNMFYRSCKLITCPSKLQPVI